MLEAVMSGAQLLFTTVCCFSAYAALEDRKERRRQSEDFLFSCSPAADILIPIPARRLFDRLYSKGSKMTAGNFGDIFECFSRKTQQGFVLKCTKCISGLERQEVEIHRKLLHPNIPRLIHSFGDEDCNLLVLERCHGDLAQSVMPKRGIPEDQLLIVIRQVLRALCFLHSKDIAHRDVKAQNVLKLECFNQLSRCTFKLADFGTSAVVKRELTGRVGTPDHVAPEIACPPHLHGVNADLWSCGVMMSFVSTGRRLFSKVRTFDHMQELFGNLEEFAKSVDRLPQVKDETRELLAGTLQLDPSSRATASAALCLLQRADAAERS